MNLEHRTKLEETAEVLETAADMLEKGKLCKGFLTGLPYYTDEGKISYSHCTMGFIRLAKSQHGYRATLCNHIMHKVLGITDIPGWNDNPERTKQDVLDGLRLGSKTARIEAEAL